MRLLKYTLIGAGICVLVTLSGAGILTWALGTERGTQWLFATLESRTSMGLSIGEVAGTLLDGVVLTDFQLALGGDRVAIARLAARWDAGDLFGGAVTLDELRVSDARYFRGDAQSDPAPGGRPSLPWRLIVERGTVDTFVLESAGQGLVFEDTTFALESIGNRLIARELATRVEGVELQAQGELRLSGEPQLNATFAWSWSGDQRDARGEGTLAGPLTRLELHHELAEPFQLLADGEIVLGATPAVDLQLRWTDLAWSGVRAVISPSGTLRLSGDIERYEFQGEGELTVDDTDTRFRVAGSGDPLNVFLEALELSVPGGELAARGQVLLQPFEWHLAIEAQDLDPSLFWTEWPGRLRGRGRFQGRLAPVFEWSASDFDVAGMLRGYALAATGSVGVQSDQWELADVELRLGPNLVTAAGSIGDTVRLDMTVDVPETELLWSGLAGALQLEAAIGGTLSRPEVAGELLGDGLSWRDYSVAEVRVAASAAPQADAPLDITLDATGLKWRNLTARAVAARVNGRNSSHAIDIGLDAMQGTAHLQADGELTPTGWSGFLQAVTVEQSVAGEWRLVAPAAVALDNGTISIEDLCLAQSSSRVCGFGHVSGTSADRIELTATDFEVQSLGPLLPDALSLEGVYNAVLHLTGPLNEPSASVSVTGGASRAALRAGGEAFELDFDGLRLDAMLEGDRIAVEGSVDAGASGSASLTGLVEDVRGPDPGVRGAMRASWNDLELLSALSPHIGAVTGELDVDLTVAGTLTVPEVAARGQLRGGALSVPAWGLDVRDVEANAASTGLRSVAFTAQGSVGEGHADVDGTMLLDPAAGWPVRLELRGEALEVVRLPEAEVDLSPELTVEFELPDIRVSGEVHVPRARLSRDELPAQAAAPSEDAVVHGVEDSSTSRTVQMQAQLRLTLGEDVTYSGSGLTTDVSGALNLEYDSSHAAVATGVVDLAGHYEAFGKTLNLEHGRLLFAGPLSNPELDVRAVREIESRALASDATAAAIVPGQAGTLRVGVDVTGTLRAPQTRMYSEPAISEADALSYLVLDRPLTGTGGAEAVTLQSAAVSMGLSQALPVIQRVGDSVGLDELTVRSTDADAGELMAGKYLSPRLYIRYTYGLFNRVGGLLLHFRLTDRLSLETRSGDDKSMDILYVVERE